MPFDWQFVFSSQASFEP